MTMPELDTLIIGGGAMGLAAAWRLAQRGREVLLVEQHGPHHEFGASHGACRNYNPAYTEPELVAMLREAREGWRELEGASGRTLLDLVGLVSHGRDPLFAEVHAALGRAGIASELLPPAEAGARWPGIRFDEHVLFTPDAGRIRADATLDALADTARAHGAELRFGVRAASLEPEPDGGAVRVRLEPGPSAETAPLAATAPATIRARTVVLAVSAWTARLAGRLLPLPELRVTEETPVHFPRYDAALAWPSFNHRPSADPRDAWWPATLYGMETPGEGIKAGWHRVGPVVDPEARPFRFGSRELAAVRRYAAEWLPGVADPDAIEPVSCTYTSTVDGAFVLDRRGPFVVLSGFGGEGFKFVPAIGRIAADLVEGRRASPRWSLDRPRTPGAGIGLGAAR